MISDISDLPYIFRVKLLETLDILLNARTNGYLNFDRIYLFGSLARGAGINCTSDIDLLLTYAEVPSQEERTNAYDFIDELSHPKVDIVVRSEQSFTDKNSTFSKLVSKDRILLWRYKQWYGMTINIMRTGIR